MTIKEPIEFEWDNGNVNKSRKHGIESSESEEAFFDVNKIILKDVLHSGTERRYISIGKTKNNKLLFIVFTMRGKKTRIISARTLNKKEVHLYEKADSDTEVQERR